MSGADVEFERLTVSQMATLLRVPRQQIMRAIRRGELRAGTTMCYHVGMEEVRRYQASIGEQPVTPTAARPASSKPDFLTPDEIEAMKREPTSPDADRQISVPVQAVLLSDRTLARMLDVSRSALSLMRKRPGFPQPVKGLPIKDHRTRASAVIAYLDWLEDCERREQVGLDPLPAPALRDKPSV